MASISPFMDDYSSENYSSSDDESFEFADDYLLVPTKAEDQPIDDHENQHDERAQVPDLETSTDFMTRGRYEPPHMDGVSDAEADKAEVWMEGFAEAVEDSDAKNAVEEQREMSDVKLMVANDVEMGAQSEAGKATVEEAALEPEVLMELTEAAIEKYEEVLNTDVVLAPELATEVEEDEAVTDESSAESDESSAKSDESSAESDESSAESDESSAESDESSAESDESSDEIDAPEPAVEKGEAIIDELSHEVDAPEPVVEGINAVIKEPSDEIDVPELAVEEDEAVIDEPAVGEDDVAVVTEVGVVIDELAVGADDVALVTEYGFMVDVTAVGAHDIAMATEYGSMVDVIAVGTDNVPVATQYGFMVEVPAVGEDLPVLAYGFAIDEPAVGADDVAVVIEYRFMIDEPAVREDVAVIDEPSEEFNSTVAQLASDGSEAMIDESSDEIDSSIEDYIAQVDRFADEITTEEYTTEAVVNHDWCSKSGGHVQSPEFDFMYEFTNLTTSTPVVIMQEMVATLQSCAEIFLRELIRLRFQVTRFICSLFDKRPPPDKSA